MTGPIAAFLNLLSLILISEKLAIGWLVGIAAECCWLRVGSEKRIPSLMFISVVYIVVAGWSFVRWGRV